MASYVYNPPKKHGQELLGKAGGGWVDIYDGDKQVSAARYTPENGGKWYNSTF